jgi:hypothetical protein
MAWPSFILIGASKSATTTIHALLDQHPDVFMSTPKEPGYWAYQVNTPYRHHVTMPEKSKIRTTSAYQALFDPGAGAIARGESSTQYISTPGIAPYLREHLPDVKLIAVLRHPVERAFSAYMHLVREGRETETDFRRALELEEERIREGYGNLWHYKNQGYYYKQLKLFYDVFPEKQIQVYLYDEFVSNPAAMLESLFCFIGVPATFRPELRERRNVSGVPRARWLYRALLSENLCKEVVKRLVPRVWCRRVKEYVAAGIMKKVQLPADCAHELSESYQEDMASLESLIGKDLSEWRVRHAG